jgi:hypothetical protein
MRCSGHLFIPHCTVCKASPLLLFLNALPNMPTSMQLLQSCCFRAHACISASVYRLNDCLACQKQSCCQVMMSIKQKLPRTPKKVFISWYELPWLPSHAMPDMKLGGAPSTQQA